MFLTRKLSRRKSSSTTLPRMSLHRLTLQLLSVKILISVLVSISVYYCCKHYLFRNPLPKDLLPFFQSTRIESLNEYYESSKCSNNQYNVVSEALQLTLSNAQTSYLNIPSGCLLSPVLRMFQFLYPHTSNDTIFIDIGFNKGYFTWELLKLWNPGLIDATIDDMRLINLLRQHNISSRSACGDELDILEPIDQSLLGHTVDHSHMHVRVYGFDLQDTVLKVADLFRQLLSDPDSLIVQNWGLSNSSYTTLTPENSDLSETFALNAVEKNTSHVHKTKVVTLDEAMQTLNLNGKRIKVLKIDTEGNDPLVLQGASQTLATQVVQLLVFEYHTIGLWKFEKLSTVVQKLKTYGFVCYYVYNPINDSRHAAQLIRVTDCFCSLLDLDPLRHWSSIVCPSALYAPAAVRLFDRISLGFSPGPNIDSQKFYLCDSKQNRQNKQIKELHNCII